MKQNAETTRAKRAGRPKIDEGALTVSLEGLAQLVGISKASASRLRHVLPPPLDLPLDRALWCRRDVEEWISKLPRRQRGAEG